MADRRTLPTLETLVPAPALVVGGPLALAVAFFLALSGMAPHAALLPTISAAAIAAAGPTALFALVMKERQARSPTLLDVAGAFVLIGCAAAILSNPEAIQQTFTVAHTQ